MAERRARSSGALVLRLYVAGGAPNSLAALARLEGLRDRLEQPQIEVIDVLRVPRRALDDRILVTPTLVKLAPPPEVRIIGNLGDTSVVLRGLGFSGDE